MNVTIEKTGNLEARIVVNIEEADYAEKVTKQLKEIGKHKEIPGFRKGHIDIVQLRKRFGKMVKSDVINDVVIEAALDYIKENNVEILARPLPVAQTEINLTDKDYTFQFELGLKPEVNVVLDKTVNLPFYKIAVEDKMIEEQDASLRQSYGDRIQVEEFEERAIVKGSIMELNEDGSVKECEGAIQKNDGMVGPFTFKSKEEAEKFVGKKVGDKVVFNPYNSCEGNAAELAAMLGIDRENVEAARGDFELSIAEIMSIRPAELNQEFFNKIFGEDTVHNEEEYKTRLREGIAEALLPNSQNLFQRQAEDYLMNTYSDMELPMEYLKKLVLASNENITEETVEAELAKEIPALKWEIIESNAAKLLDVKVAEEDLKAYAQNIAASQLRQYGLMQMGEEMVNYYADNMLKDKSIRERVAREAFLGKLMGSIHAAVTLDEKTVSLDEFRGIVASLNETEETAE